MATTTTIHLTDEQRQAIAIALRVSFDVVPEDIGLVAVSPEAGETMGLPRDLQSQFLPTLLIT